jgi:DNA helicase IV
VSSHGYDEELQSEREYVAGLYTRLDAERARVKRAYTAALGGNGLSAMERDDEVRALAKEAKRLAVADNGLCFGRLDTITGEHSYVGRLGLFDEKNDYEPVLLDWRAPAARPFYVATAATPENMRRRRQFLTRGRQILDFTDEVLGRPDGDARGDAALLAAVNAPRGEGMRDIVATIQAEQDEIIRLDHPGVLVIEGGPGTGKTEDTQEAVRLKGSLKILDVLAAAIADRQRLPAEPVPITMADVTVWIDAATAEWAREEARASGLPHNDARAVFTEIITYVLTERAIGRIGRGWLKREDRDAWEQLRKDLLKELADDERFTATLDDLWPMLTPETLLADLYTSPERLRAAGGDPALSRVDGTAWTVSDVALLDELVDMIGRDKEDERAVEQERKAQAAYAEGVLDSLVSRQDSMDDEDHLFATDLLYAEDLADRFVEHDTRDLVERATADRDWTYRHIVVDEAQELSEMDWRVLMRRCPGHSFTVVGDLAQRRSAAGATSWATMLEPYVPGRWVYRSLTVNYRTPAEIMAVAASVLAEFAPTITPPESVRATGVQPWSRQVSDDLAEAIEEFVLDEADREGTSIVIGPPGVPGTVPASETKGLEFDAVLVVEPERILADGPRGAAELYVALTRATQRLGVLHKGPLPAALTGLTARQTSSATRSA